MKKIIVSTNEAGQRMDKLLAKYLSSAPKGFLYKMLRKKNITLNGKKALGNEKLNTGDEICMFLADATLEKFGKGTGGADFSLKKALEEKNSLTILYEDGHILILDKPCGMLSQKASPKDVSLNEYMISYLLKTGQLSYKELESFRPSVCNRLDRNTSGIITAGKSLAALQQLGAMLHGRSLKKYYLAIVSGEIKEAQKIDGFLKKDERTNKVTVKAGDGRTDEMPGGQKIETEYVPIAGNGQITLLKVHLITGRTHQIRAHLSFGGHPIIGDPKYGDRSVNAYYRRKYRIQEQLLHAWKLEFPECQGALKDVSGRTVTAPLPSRMLDIIKGESIWGHGIQEVLEVPH